MPGCCDTLIGRWISAQYLEQPVAQVTVHKSVYYKLLIDKCTTVLLHTGDDKKVKQLFYATVHSLMRPKTCRS
jgi:hypothetical protein